MKAKKAIKKPAKKPTKKLATKAVTKPAKKIAKAAPKKSAVKKVAPKKVEAKKVAKKTPAKPVKKIAKSPVKKAVKSAIKKVVKKPIKKVVKKSSPVKPIKKLAPKKAAKKTVARKAVKKAAPRKLIEIPAKLYDGPAWPLMDVVLAALDDAKAEAVLPINLEGRSSMADGMVIATGRVNRHVAAIADQLVEKLKASGQKDVRVEGLEQADWVLVDAGNIIVHIFRPEVRSFYNLEKLWSEHAPQEKREE